MIPDIARLVIKYAIIGAIKFAGHITPKKPDWWKKLEDRLGKKEDKK